MRKVQYSQTGGTEVLTIVEVEDPEPTARQVRVAVRTAGINPYDSKMRRGQAPATLPSGQGSEFAGVVDLVGTEVSDIAVGDEVIGWTFARAQAEFVVVPATSVTPKPQALGWAIAGALTSVADTAWQSTAALELTPDDVVLVTGAAGSVGMLTCQFVRQIGATVLGTARPESHEFLQRLGVIPVAYGEGEIERMRAAAPGAVSAVLDTVGESGVDLGLALGVAPGRINSIAYWTPDGGPAISNVGGGRKSRDQIASFARDVDSGALVLPVRAEFPLESVAEAYDELETGHGIGKIVLIVR